jgi:hypothetical protein
MKGREGSVKSVERGVKSVERGAWKRIAYCVLKSEGNTYYAIRRATLTFEAEFGIILPNRITQWL